MIPKLTIPRSPFKGFNTKLTGRVSNKMLFKAANSGPIEFQRSATDQVEKTASSATEATGPVEFHGREKTAASFTINPALKTGFLQGMGALGAAAVATGVSKGLEYAGNMMNEQKYDAALRTAIQMSPTLQRHGYDVLKGYMPMIAKASPTVAAEPRLLANYLESMLDAEGHLNMATMGELLSLEGQVLKNRGAKGTSLGGQFADIVARTGMEAAAKDAFKGVR